MNVHSMKRTLALSTLTLVCLSIALTNADRQSAGRRLEPPGGAKTFKSKCGSAEEIARRIGRCLDPVFDLVEGNFTVPKTDQDIVGHCDRFSNCERCIRVITKECLTGLHKTAVGTVASSTKKFKQQECKTAANRARYTEPLKCGLKKGREMGEVYKTFTGMLQGIRDLPIAPEDKLMRTCCIMNQLDKELEMRYNRDCPESTAIIMQMTHAVSDDVRTTMCRNPKCNGVLDVVKNHKYVPPQAFIEPIMQILLQINTD